MVKLNFLFFSLKYGESSCEIKGDGIVLLILLRNLCLAYVLVWPSLTFYLEEAFVTLMWIKK